MPKKEKNKGQKLDAAMFFGGDDKQLAKAPAQRDDGDDGLSRFPDRDKRRGDDRQQSSRDDGDEGRADGDDNWFRGPRQQQPGRDDRFRPSRDGNPDEDWSRGGNGGSQRGGRDDFEDQDPNAPQAGRADAASSWERGTAKQPTLEFREGGAESRSDESSWGRGTAKQPSFEFQENNPREDGVGRSDAESSWGRGTAKQPTLEFQQTADDGGSWERGKAKQPTFEVRGGYGNGLGPPQQSKAETSGWARGIKRDEVPAEGQRPARLRNMGSKLNKKTVMDTHWG